MKAYLLDRKARPLGAWKIHSQRPLGRTCFTLVQPLPSSGAGSGLQMSWHC